MTEDVWALEGKKLSDSDNEFVAYSTHANKVDKIHPPSLSKLSISHKDNARQASPKAECSENHSKGKSENFFSKLEASCNAGHRLHQEEDVFDEGNLLVRRRSMSRQHNYHQKNLLMAAHSPSVRRDPGPRAGPWGACPRGGGRPVPPVRHAREPQ